VLRILKAQDFEANTRKGYEMIMNMFDSMHVTDKGSPHDVDEYVQLVMAIEQRYYVNHFLDERLSAIADYSESGAGQVTITRMPVIRRELAHVIFDELTTAFSSLDKVICQAMACSSEQRKRVTDLTKSLTAQFPQAFQRLYG
jgi:hypothetical protein